MKKYLTLLTMITGLWATTKQPYVHDFENKTSIDDSFKVIKQHNILCIGQNITFIGNHFIYCCTSLTSVKLSVSYLTSIGDEFLLNCNSLTTLDINLESED